MPLSRFRGVLPKSTVLRFSGPAGGERKALLLKPRDGNRLTVQGRLPKDRIVAATLEADRDPVPLDLDGPSGLGGATVQLLGGRLLETSESRCQSAVTAVGDRGRCRPRGCGAF